jgi:hypothetical protein
MSNDQKKVRQKQVALMNQLHDVIAELDWVMGVPKETTTTGLIIGSIQYVIEKCDIIYGKDNYEIVGHPRILGQELPEQAPATSDNKQDFELIEMTEEEFKHYLETDELPENPRILSTNKGPTYH